MKHIKKFSTPTDRESFLASVNNIPETPYIHFVESTGDVIFSSPEVDIPLYIKALANFTVKFSNNYEYSKDNVTWTSASNSISISVTKGERVFFRATGLTPSVSSGIGYFAIGGKCNVGGNVMSMVYGGDFKGQTEITNSYQFYRLFAGCSNIIDASGLVLPATTLSQHCYKYMFVGCTSLTQAPVLPATKLTYYCYGYMFQGCTSLTKAPTLPATTVVNSCYHSMFQGCTSLTKAPTLPATALADSCYSSMFKDCTSLTTAPELPATILSQYCYGYMFQGCTSLTQVPTLPATTLSQYCCQYMFQGCTSLKTAPELLATSLADYCYQYMFQGCTSLTQAPTLPAINLSKYCYQHMFSGCTSLTTAPELPATNSAWCCYSSMFSGCTSLTTAPSILPATALADSCYSSMFKDCTSLTTAPELPATSLAESCYGAMFYGCTSLTQAPTLPATVLRDSCYDSMFYGTNVLPDCTNINFSNPFTNSSEGLNGLFAGTKVTDSDLERILPKNSNGKYCLPATVLRDSCYHHMFKDCTSLTTAPELPAKGMGSNCYEYMFENCTNLTTAPELPATSLADYCYQYMFQGCTSLTTAPELPATILKRYCYGSMFKDCTSLTTAPALSATTSAYHCCHSMFQGCTSLTTAPALSATLADSCYKGMFSGCTSLTQAPELPATSLAIYCYQSMFNGCTSLTQAPELPAKTLLQDCYNSMFYGCTKLNYIKMLATNISALGCLGGWVTNVASTGILYKNRLMTTLPKGVSGIPTGWVVEDNITLTVCKSLTLSANDVKGVETTTTVTWVALCEGFDDEGTTIEVEKTGTFISDPFPQNTSTTETITRTISFTYMDVTATTTFVQDIYVPMYCNVDLNNNWQISSINPDSAVYDSYESFSNKGIGNSGAIMYIDIFGYSTFKLYIRSYAESSYDYVMVSQLDKTITYSTSYSDSSLIKAHTRGNQQSGTALSNYKLVEFTNIDGGEHRISVIYRKDGSANSGTDMGYILIPKQ